MVEQTPLLNLAGGFTVNPQISGIAVSATNPVPIYNASFNRTTQSSQRAVITASTGEATIVTAAVGIYNDLYGLILTNTGYSGTQVDIRNTTAGSIILTFYVPAGDVRGLVLPTTAAILQTSTNTNWTATCGTATSSLIVTALFCENT